MNLRQLEYAVAVRDEGSISGAAEVCHVSQPSLSQGIRKLEEQLQVTLFERKPSGAEPTPAGEPILEKAESILAEVRALEEMASETTLETMEGTFRIGVIRTVGPYLLPLVARHLEQKFPDFQLEVVEGLTDNLLEDVFAHDLDAAIIALPWDLPEGTEVHEAYREQFFTVFSEDDPLAEVADVAIDDIDPDEILLLDEGHCLREHALEVCQIPESDLRRRFRGASLETIRQFVMAGWGVSLFPGTALDEDDDLVVRRPGAEAYRDIVVVTRSSFPRQESIARLAAFLEETVADRAAGAHLDTD